MRQLELFLWADPPPAPVRAAACGFRVWHPCACGSTHSMVFLTAPYEMIGLRHWRISARDASVARMMAERHSPQRLSEVAA